MQSCCDNPSTNGQDAACEDQAHRPVLPITLQDGADGLYHTAWETLRCFLAGEIDRQDADTIFHGIAILTSVGAFGEPLAAFHAALGQHKAKRQQEIADLRKAQRKITDRLDQLLQSA